MQGGKEVAKKFCYALASNLDSHLGYLSFEVRVCGFGSPEKMLHRHNFVAAAVLIT